MNRRHFNRILAATGSAGVLSSIPAALRAQQWPSRPISLVIPFPPGGNTDFMARITAEYLSKALGTPVVPENKAGAGGTIAAEAVARAPADGHTLFFATITQVSLAPFLYKIRYDPLKDFVPISNVGGNPLVLTVSSSSRFQNLDEIGRASCRERV
jgi:tripartite-type tricarboxylate transporter receptor subunit TctC